MEQSRTTKGRPSNFTPKPDPNSHILGRSILSWRRPRERLAHLATVADFLDEAAALEQGLVARLCPAGKGGGGVHQPGGAVRGLSSASMSATCVHRGIAWRVGARGGSECGWGGGMSRGAWGLLLQGWQVPGSRPQECAQAELGCRE